MTRFEWPRNSGRVADYNDDELDQLYELLNSGHKGVHLEIELLHTFKVEFPGSTMRRMTPSDQSSSIPISTPFPADTAG